MNGLSTYCYATLGCKVNAYETNALCQELKATGLSFSPDEEHADLLIVNTCSVTAKAGQKSRQRISSLRKRNPHAVLLVMGCYSQTYADIVASLGADIVLGSSSRSRALEHIKTFLETRKQIIDVAKSVRHESYEELGYAALTENARAYLKVQDGCDAFCSYCYIPQLRGNSRSREPRNVIEEATRLVSSGYKEIVLTGIHTGMYGRDLGDGSYGLNDLIASLLDKLPALPRLRISSLEENEVDDGFLSLLRRYPLIADHLHIPLQSGSDAVLQSMKRRYDVNGYLSALARVREIRPDIAITADVIVGYPTETEQEFQETMETCRKAGLAEIHVFPFSPRPGTYAASLKDLPSATKKDRVGRLLALSKELRAAYEKRFYGKKMTVLVEQVGEDGVAEGHTSNYLLVRFLAPEARRGDLIDVIYDSTVASD